MITYFQRNCSFYMMNVKVQQFVEHAANTVLGFFCKKNIVKKDDRHVCVSLKEHENIILHWLLKTQNRNRYSGYRKMIFNSSLNRDDLLKFNGQLN